MSNNMNNEYLIDENEEIIERLGYGSGDDNEHDENYVTSQNIDKKSNIMIEFIENT